MNDQMTKTISVEFDRDQLANLVLIMYKHHRDHPNRAQRTDIAEIRDILINAINEIDYGVDWKKA